MLVFENALLRTVEHYLIAGKLLTCIVLVVLICHFVQILFIVFFVSKFVPFSKALSKTKNAKNRTKEQVALIPPLPYLTGDMSSA